MDSLCNESQEKQQTCKFDAFQIQFKDKLFKYDNVQVKISNHSISLTLLNLSMQIRINFKDIISVAKNSKTSNLFSIIILTKGAQTQQEFYDEEEQQEDQINKTLTKEQQIIQAFQERRKKLDQNSSMKIFELEGFFSVKIGRNLAHEGQTKLQEKKNSQNVYIEQLEKHIGANDYKNRIIEQSENVYEKIIKKLNQLQEKETNQNNNAEIHSLIGESLMGAEQNSDEGEWIEQENMDEQQIKE